MRQPISTLRDAVLSEALAAAQSSDPLIEQSRQITDALDPILVEARRSVVGLESELIIPSPMVELSQQMSSIMDPIVLEAQRIAEVFRREFAFVQETSAAIQRFLDSIPRITPEQFEGMQRVLDAMERMEEVGRFGWTIPMRATPGQIVFIVDEAVDELSADTAFEQIFLDDNGELLNNLLRTTLASKRFGSFTPIVEDAVALFRRGRYQSCTTLLTPVFEGVLSETLNNDSFNWRRCTDHIDKCIAKVGVRSIAGTQLKCLKGFFDGFLEQIDFKNPNGRAPKAHNRHWLLHARMVASDSRVHCIKLLQALDVLSKFALRSSTDQDAHDD